MQNQQIIDQLEKLKLSGMAQAVVDQTGSSDYSDLGFQERIAMIIEREIVYRDNRKLHNLLRYAKFRQSATLEDIVYPASRGISKSKVLSIANGNFIHHKRNIIVTGATGCGKTYLACAIGHKACQMGYKVKYIHLPKFLEELAIARVDGSLQKLMSMLNKIDLIILDDFGLTPITPTQRHDIFTMIEDRYQRKSTMITSQFPINKWHDYLAEPTLADAILDRVLENVERIELKGESLRKQKKVEIA